MIEQKAETVLAEYFRRMAEIRSTGAATSETSYYSALENLLNALGAKLKPAVICNGQLRNQGAGHPDFGLYTKDQLSKGEPLLEGKGEIPARGVIEVKPLKDESWQTAKSAQATKYFDRYRLVLITNYRDFRLIGEDANGKPIEREFFSLADKDAAFWALAAKPDAAAKKYAVHFDEFLRRVLMNAAPLTRPEDIAWFLASYAREALKTLEEKEAGTLKPLQDALEGALGVTFRGEKGAHFFKSTLVQTLFYGVFSAWVIAARKGSAVFDWKTTAHILTVPMIRSLFEEMAKPTRLKPLGLTSLLDRTGEALSRVDRLAFFKSFDAGLAVQHFYEPFLQAFDPELRKELGVWYTPPEIVRYMVERIDRTLRSELGIAEGLANENVYVLDPCCGTGAYLVEVLRRIERTHRENGADALMGDDIKEAAKKRIFGFEILPASFVVAHWQIGNLLADINAPLDAAKNERPAIYLTNALTGWEPPKGAKANLDLFPELEEERDAAEHVKRDVPILVVLGNPPYNAYAGTSPEEEQGLVEPYKDGLIKKWGIKKFNLDELYVRFMRLAERRVAEHTGKGIVCYISSFSYLGDPSYVVMREHLLNSFDHIWIDSLNGDSRETGKRTPDGRPDPSVFSTKLNPAGIQLGTSVGLLVRKEKHGDKPVVHYRDFWGTEKREELLASLDASDFNAGYIQADPQPHNRYSLRPVAASVDYLAWPSIPEIGQTVLNGPIERRAMSLIRYPDQRQQMLEAMIAYLNPDITDEATRLIEGRFLTSSGEFDAKNVRKSLRGKVQAADEKIVSYPFKPFDMRIAYLDNDIAPLFSRPAPDLLAHRTSQNWFLISRDTADKTPEGAPFFASKLVCDYDFISGHARHFPIMMQEKTKKAENQHAMDFNAGSAWKANLSKPAQQYLKELKCPSPDKDFAVAELPWLHALAIGFAPEYLSENAQAIANNWPRIPLPDSRKQLEASAALGRKLAALLDAETPLATEEYHKALGVISAADLSVTTGWGRLDKLGKVFPGAGKIEKRPYTKEELQALGGREKALGAALDIYLNDATCWRCVPEAVWEYYIGGYQPIKKWLSYREQPILGRALTKEEARYIMAVVRRLASIILLSEEMNQNYIACRDHAYSWSPTS